MAYIDWKSVTEGFDALYYPMGETGPIRVTVKRLTKTQAVLSNGSRVSRRTGWVVGEGSTFRRPWVGDFDAKRLQEAEDDRERRRLVERLRSAPYGSYSLEVVRKVAAALPSDKAVKS